MYPHYLHHTPRPACPVASGLPAGSQLAEVILLRSELIHDIEAGIHQIERSRTATTPGASAAGNDILPNGASDNYLLARHIDTAVNQAVSRCQAYLLVPSPYVHRFSTNHTTGWEEKSILLAMPATWANHCIEPLRDAIHNYIVYRAMQLFLAFSDEKAAGIADAMAAEYYNNISVQLSARTKPLSCGFTPLA